MRSYLRVSTLVFGLLATAQLIRVILRWPVVVAGLNVPLWVSVIAVLVVGSMAGWGMRTLARMHAAAVA